MKTNTSPASAQQQTTDRIGRVVLAPPDPWLRFFSLAREYAELSRQRRAIRLQKETEDDHGASADDQSATRIEKTTKVAA